MKKRENGKNKSTIYKTPHGYLNGELNRVGEKKSQTDGAEKMEIYDISQWEFRRKQRKFLLNRALILLFHIISKSISMSGYLKSPICLPNCN